MTDFYGLHSARQTCRAWYGSMLPQTGSVRRIVLPGVFDTWEFSQNPPVYTRVYGFDELLGWALDIAGEGSESLDTGPTGYKLTDAGLDIIANSRMASSLTSLHMPDSGVSDTGIGLLASLVNLTYLNMEGIETSLETVALLPSITHLKIDIFRPDERAQNVENLRAMPRLVSLSFGSQTIISDRDLPKLPRQLRILALPEYREQTEPRITDKGLEMLPRGLTSLDLSDIEYVTNEGIRSLPRLLPGLTYLRLGHCSVGITDDAIASLTALKSLELLDIRDIGFPVFEEAMTELTGRFKVLYTQYSED